MIDLHTHILPGIDDGPKTPEEAAELLEELYKQNVEVAVCTPHFNPSEKALKEFLIQRREAMKCLSYPGIQLISGSEVTLNDYLFHYSDLSQLCIGNTNYILIELPFDKKWPKKLYQQLERLIDYYNFIPIIAHIERYPAVKKRKKVLNKLFETGCLFQLNADSIINKKSRHLTQYYIKHGYADIISSDCHNMNLRPPVLSEAYDIVKRRLGIEYYDKLRTNCGLILKGQELRKKTNYYIIDL